jgi:hypothetical protein
MRVIYTNDGLIGLDFDKHCDVIWCHNQEEAVNLMHANFSKLGPDAMPTKEELAKDLAYGINHCAKTQDTIIEFGVFGGFMYTTKEQDNEF